VLLADEGMALLERKQISERRKKGRVHERQDARAWTCAAAGRANDWIKAGLRGMHTSIRKSQPKRSGEVRKSTYFNAVSRRSRSIIAIEQ